MEIEHLKCHLKVTSNVKYHTSNASSFCLIHLDIQWKIESNSTDDIIKNTQTRRKSSGICSCGNGKLTGKFHQESKALSYCAYDVSLVSRLADFNHIGSEVGARE